MQQLTVEQMLHVSGGLLGPDDIDGPDPTLNDIVSQMLEGVTVTGDASSFNDVITNIQDSFGNMNWGNIFAGIAVVAGAITAIALSPAAVPILGVAGVWAIVAEFAGIGITAWGATGH